MSIKLNPKTMNIDISISCLNFKFIAAIISLIFALLGMASLIRFIHYGQNTIFGILAILGFLLSTTIITSADQLLKQKDKSC